MSRLKIYDLGTASWVYVDSVAPVSVGPSAPALPVDGQLWWDNDDTSLLPQTADVNALAVDVAFTSRYQPLAVWTSYTPVMSGAGWALGTGTITGRYIIDAPKKIRTRGKFTAASGSTFGGSQLVVSLPPFASHASMSRAIGSVVVVATNVWVGVCWINAASSSLLFYSITSATGQVGSLVQAAPATLVSGSTIEWEIEYEAA